MVSKAKEARRNDNSSLRSESGWTKSFSSCAARPAPQFRRDTFFVWPHAFSEAFAATASNFGNVDY